jgi:hypothetical protein
VQKAPARKQARNHTSKQARKQAKKQATHRKGKKPETQAMQSKAKESTAQQRTAGKQARATWGGAQQGNMQRSQQCKASKQQAKDNGEEVTKSVPNSSLKFRCAAGRSARCNPKILRMVRNSQRSAIAATRAGFWLLENSFGFMADRLVAMQDARPGATPK